MKNLTLSVGKNAEVYNSNALEAGKELIPPSMKPLLQSREQLR
jgi:hypothetical protein